MVSVDGAPFLVWSGGLLAWTPGGYRDSGRPTAATTVTVITPRATVAVLAAGYRPVIHPSAVGVSHNGGLGPEPARDVEAERLAGDHGAQVGFQHGQPTRAERAGPPGPDVVEDHRGLR